jgi:hypothetical protein
LVKSESPHGLRGRFFKKKGIRSLAG